MGHVHTESNSYALTRVTDQIILMSLSGVCLECRHRRSTTGLIFFFFFFFAFSPVWRPLRYVHAIILPLKPFLSILNQPSSMGYYIDKVGNAVS